MQLIPNPSFGLKLSKPSITKKYKNAVNFLDNAKLPSLFIHFAIKALRDGTYYGLISNVSNKGLVILDLPTKYCRSNYIDSDGNDVLEFNVQYFDSIIDLDIRENTLSVYPEFIVNWYRRYKKGKVKKLPDYSVQQPVTDAERAIFDAACSNYQFPLGTPQTFGKRATPDGTDYKFTVTGRGMDGKESSSIIYVTVGKGADAKPEFTQVVR